LTVPHLGTYNSNGFMVFMSNKTDEVICLNVRLNIVLTSSIVKTITVRDEVYRKLLAVKREGESFSELFERLVRGIEPIETLKRLRGCVELDDKDEVLSRIYMAREERRP